MSLYQKIKAAQDSKDLDGTVRGKSLEAGRANK
jgi:hypothetical protein